MTKKIGPSKKSLVTITVAIVMLLIGIILVSRGILLNTFFETESSSQDIQISYNEPLEVQIKNQTVSGTMQVINLPQSSETIQAEEGIWVVIAFLDRTAVGILNQDNFFEFYSLPSNSKVHKMYTDQTILFSKDGTLYITQNTKDSSAIISFDGDIVTSFFDYTVKSFFTVVKSGNESTLFEVSAQGSIISQISLGNFQESNVYISKPTESIISFLYIDQNFTCIDVLLTSKTTSQVLCRNTIIPQYFLDRTEQFVKAHIVDKKISTNNAISVSTFSPDDVERFALPFTDFFMESEESYYGVEFGELYFYEDLKNPVSAPANEPILEEPFTDIYPLEGIYL